jgi:hypothetical protein
MPAGSALMTSAHPFDAPARNGERVDALDDEGRLALRGDGGVDAPLAAEASLQRAPLHAR